MVSCCSQSSDTAHVICAAKILRHNVLSHYVGVKMTHVCCSLRHLSCTFIMISFLSNPVSLLSEGYRLTSTFVWINEFGSIVLNFHRHCYRKL